jgi:hypothetical protein
MPRSEEATFLKVSEIMYTSMQIGLSFGVVKG